METDAITIAIPMAICSLGALLSVSGLAPRAVNRPLVFAGMATMLASMALLAMFAKIP